MTGMARAMVQFLASLLGHVRGGLSYVLIGAMYLVSGISGSKAADMAAIAPVLFPEMQQRGAKPGDLVALLAATGAQTETIPPSIVLITIGSVTGVSIAALFTGGLLPALVLGAALCVVVWWRYRHEDLPRAARYSEREIAELTMVALPAILLPFVIRTAVVEGVATATEVSTIGIVYAVLMGLLVYRQFRLAAAQADAGRDRVADAAPSSSSSAAPSTSAGSRPPVNSAAIDTPVTEPMVISTMLGGMSRSARRSRTAARPGRRAWRRAASSRETAPARSPPCRPTFEPEMPDTRYIAPISTYDSPPRTWPSRLARNWIIARAMPVISISAPRKMNSGTASRIRCDMPSSIRPTITSIGVERRQRQIAEGRQREREGDRHAGEHVDRDHADEEDDQVELAERRQHRAGEPEQRRRPRATARPRHASAQPHAAQQAQQRDHEHQPDADRDRRRAPGVADLERRRDDESPPRWRSRRRVRQDQQQERQRGGQREASSKARVRGADARDERRHAHVLAAPQRHHGAEHRQPQEQDRRQLVRPDERACGTRSATITPASSTTISASDQRGGRALRPRTPIARSSVRRAPADPARRRDASSGAHVQRDRIGAAGDARGSGELADGAFEQAPGLVAEALLPLARRSRPRAAWRGSCRGRAG